MRLRRMVFNNSISREIIRYWSIELDSVLIAVSVSEVGPKEAKVFNRGLMHCEREDGSVWEAELSDNCSGKRSLGMM